LASASVLGTWTYLKATRPSFVRVATTCTTGPIIVNDQLCVAKGAVAFDDVADGALRGFRQPDLQGR